MRISFQVNVIECQKPLTWQKDGKSSNRISASDAVALVGNALNPACLLTASDNQFISGEMAEWSNALVC